MIEAKYIKTPWTYIIPILGSGMGYNLVISLGCPPPQVDNWTPRHGQSCNCFAGNDSSTRTCIATSCPRQPTDVIYSDAAYSFWGYARISYKWITCHISSWRCIMRMFGQHRIGSMAFIIHNLLSWFIIYKYIIATFYSYIDCRFWPWPWFFLNWKNQYFTNLNYIRSHSRGWPLQLL